MTRIDIADPCFVFGCALDGNGGCRDVGDEDIDRAQTWLHVDYSFPGSDKWLRATGIDDHVVDLLTRRETRPRVVHTDQGDLLFLRGINMNPGADPEDMVSLRLWVTQDRLVSVRQRRLMAVQDMNSDLRAGVGPTSIGKLVVALIERLADRVDGFVDTLSEKLEAIESALERAPESRSRSDISAIRRQAASVRRYLAPQREALDAFSRHTRLAADDIDCIRDQSDRFMRLVEDIDLLRERAMVLQEELMNQTMQQQSNRMYALSIIAAIFLPVTFITGVFGMNVAGLPGLDDPTAFPVVAIAMAAIMVAVMIFFRIKRWL